MLYSFRFFCVLTFLSYSCSGNEGTRPSASTLAQSNKSSIQIFDKLADFPPCNESTKNSLVFSKEDRRLYICDGSTYTVSNDSGPSDTGLISKVDCPEAIPSLPNTSGLMGQLAFSLPVEVDPCSVQGYVVGNQATLKVGVTQSGDYFINNVPPGDHDIVVQAGTLQIKTGLTAEKDLGIRLNKVTSITGLSNHFGKIGLQKLGAIAGKATLQGINGITDFAGILVYIPGTEFNAYTDSEGSYAISSIPPGVHNLYFEKDGFSRGQVGGVAVASEEVTAISDVSLGLSTSVNGSFLVTNSFTASGRNIIPADYADVLTLPSATSVLMMLKPGDEDGQWEPIRTNTRINFDIDSMIESFQIWNPSATYVTSPVGVSLSGKFADANGLESDVIHKNYYLDLFSNGTLPYSNSFIATLHRNPLRIDLTNIVNPAKGERVSINYWQDMYYNQTLPPFESIASSKTITLKDRISSCGLYFVDLIYEGYGGKVRSGNESIYGQYNTEFVLNECYDKVSPTGSPQLKAFTYNDKYANAVWTEEGIFTLGYSENDLLTAAIYDAASDTWTSVNTAGTFAPTTVLKQFELINFANFIVLYGGTNTSGNTHPYVYVYDLSSDSWIDPDPQSSGPELNTGNWHSGSQIKTDGEKLYFISSQNVIAPISGETSILYRVYDPANAIGGEPWSEEKFIPTESTRYQAVYSIFDGKMLIAGGTDYSNPYLTTKIFDFSTEVLSNGGMLPAASSLVRNNGSFSQYVQASGEIFFHSGNGESAHVLKYSTNDNSWVKIQMGTSPYYGGDAKLAFVDGELVEVRGSSVKFYTLGSSSSLSGRYAFSNFNSYSDPNLNSALSTVWKAESSQIILPIPELKKAFVFGEFYQTYTNGQSVTTHNNKAIMLDLDYSENWIP